MINKNNAVPEGINSLDRVWGGDSETVRKGVIVNEVYETTDYTIFKPHKRNRNVITRRDMLEQAKEGIVSPIIINGEMIIIDGQNRLHHSMMVGAPVKYIIDETLTIDDITRMNTNQEKWTLRDWIESYANEGREEYEKLIYIINNHYPDVGVVIALGMNITSTSESRKNAMGGDYRFHNYDMLISFFEYFKRFKEGTKTQNNSNVAKAVYQLFRVKKFDRDRLIRKVITTRFDEEIRDKRLTQTAVLRGFLDSYNDRLNDKSDSYIDYFIKSNGQIIINENLDNWAKKKTADSDQ